MTHTVDSYRFLAGMSKRLVKTWISKERPRAIPWTLLEKPLADCTVALISTGGIALETDTPFDQEAERQNPWWGDPTYRVIPRTATAKDICVYHQHINPEFAEQDLNCILPLEPLLELEANGEIGRAALSHYSFMGYTLQPETLVDETAPAMIRHLEQEEVDVVVLVPV